MTAFVRLDAAAGEAPLSFEIRSVNHRYLDLSFRLPEALRGLEPALRARCQARLTRGKVDVGARLEAAATTGGELDARALDAILERLRAVGAALEGRGLAATAVDPLRLLEQPGLLRRDPADAEALRERALALFDQALDALCRERAREGEALTHACRERLDAIEVQRERVRAGAADVTRHQEARLRARLAELAAEVPAERIAQEVALQAQRLDVDEELDRLGVHLKEARRVLDGQGPVGRRLDFLMQELHREVNTIASKAATADVTAAAVELKVLVDQIREQVQNLE
jgi:uncharacterized protein (TIGR00255 family)